MVVLLTLQALQATCEGDGNDLASYCQSSRALGQGYNPYATGSPFPFIYPLFLPLIIIPLAFLPCPAATLIWTLMGLAALTGTVMILKRHVAVQLPVALLVGLFLITFDVIQNNVVNGQVNFLVLFLCTLAFDFDARNRHLPAALALGAAAAIKLTPLVLLCFLLVRRRWLTAGATVLFFLGFCLAPGLLPGVDLRALYGDYIQGFLTSSLADGSSPRGHAVFSLVGILSRMGLQFNSLATIVTMLLIPGAGMVWDSRLTNRGSDSGRIPHDLRAFSLYLLTPLFMVPMSEVHHLVQALPANICLVAMAKMSTGGCSRILLGLSLAVYLAGSLVGRDGPLYFVSLVLLTWGIISCFPGHDQERALGE